jgi:hypothetical protein
MVGTGWRRRCRTPAQSHQQDRWHLNRSDLGERRTEGQHGLGMPRPPPHWGPMKAAEFLPAARSRRHPIEQTPAPIGLQRQTHIGASPRGYGVAQSQAVPDGAWSALSNYPRQGVEVLTRPLPMSHICMEPLVMQRVEGGRSECEPASNGSSTNFVGDEGSIPAWDARLH